MRPQILGLEETSLVVKEATTNNLSYFIRSSIFFIFFLHQDSGSDQAPVHLLLAAAPEGPGVSLPGEVVEEVVVVLEEPLFLLAGKYLAGTGRLAILPEKTWS